MPLDRSRINHLIAKKIYGGNMEGDDLNDLEEWLQLPFNREFFEDLRHAGKLSDRLHIFQQFDTAEGLAKLEERMDGSKVVVMKRRWVFSAAAASVLLLLSVATFYWNTNRKDASTAKVQEKTNKPPGEIKPGKDGAILKISSGETIMLEDVANGNLKTGEGTQVTKKDGTLAYGQDIATRNAPLYHTLSTPRGRQFRLQLPDGSRIMLNAESSITYPTRFTEKTRSVSITGEAYFEIAPDRARPFVVAVRGSEVEVLGTTFNINSYMETLKIRATLVEGMIKVSNGNKKVVIKPGEQALVADEEIETIPNADVEKEIAWTRGLIVLNDVSLKEIMNQISRWFDVDIEYRGEIKSTAEFNGKIPRNLDLSVVLDGLHQNSGLNFRIEGTKVVVSP